MAAVCCTFHTELLYILDFHLVTSCFIDLLLPFNNDFCSVPHGWPLLCQQAWQPIFIFTHMEKCRWLHHNQCNRCFQSKFLVYQCIVYICFFLSKITCITMPSSVIKKTYFNLFLMTNTQTKLSLPY